MSFEDDLRQALRREPAPSGFAARVLAETVVRDPRVLPFWRRPLTLALAAALALGVLLPPGIYEYQQRQRGIRARNQVFAALAITRTQLKQAKDKIKVSPGTRRKI
jgi:hypothetical protein